MIVKVGLDEASKKKIQIWKQQLKEEKKHREVRRKEQLQQEKEQKKQNQEDEKKRREEQLQQEKEQNKRNKEDEKKQREVQIKNDKKEFVCNFVDEFYEITSNINDKVQSSNFSRNLNEASTTFIDSKTIKEVLTSIQGISSKRSKDCNLFCGLKQK